MELLGGAFTLLKQGFKTGLEFFQDQTGSYALAIVVLTIAVRILIAPLFVVQMRSMKKFQELQPQVEALRKKYDKDPERLQREVIELYRKHGANPMLGCLPLLAQLPFLFAFYQALVETPMPERLFGFIPLDQPDPYWILPILAGVTTFIQTWLSSGGGKDPNQRVMLFIMPPMITWFASKIVAGLSLYWVVSTVVGIIQQAIYPGFGQLRKGDTAVR